jgi:tetratricopeptide (TPR) repeat protein
MFPGMRLFVLALASALVLPAAGPAGAESLLDGARRAPSSDRAVRSALPPDRTTILKEAFAALAAAKSPAEARGPERRVVGQLAASGSDSVDLFMGWAAEAMTAKDFPRALDLLDQVILMKPDFAEGYNRRATVYYALDDYRLSIADIRTTLTLEPRHFGALSGLAAILEEIGETERAREIYRRVLEIHPTMQPAREKLEALDADAEGEPT